MKNRSTGQAPTVTVIPATADRRRLTPLGESAKKLVAAYARVSTDSKEQKESFDAQVSFYTEHIKSNPDWELVEVYTDEAITATNTKKRKDFNRMIDDAMDGKIDLIITKSISRFARNTVDSLSTIRKLKAKGVDVYFEKENIHTLDSKGELLITIMSSIAQDESRSISENVTWGQRKRMADGKVTMPYGRFLGYEKGKDNNPKIVEREAEVVRKIYALFLDGETYRNIAEFLTDENIPTPASKVKWSVSTVRSILANEKYTGNAILQKKFTVDFLTKKQKINEGEVPQYYVENSHPAIVSEETYNLVQDEVRRRQAYGKRLSGNGLFFGKIVCSDCGCFYGAKVWHSTDRYRRVIWQCNGKYKSHIRCPSSHITEEALKTAFVAALQILMREKESYLSEIQAKIDGLSDTASLDEQTAALRMICAEAAAEVDDWIAQNARTVQDQTAYIKRYDALVAKYDAAKQKLENLEDKKRNDAAQKEKLRRFLNFLEQMQEPMTVFNEIVWKTVIESVTVYSDSDMLFMFRGGVTLRCGQDNSNDNGNKQKSNPAEKTTSQRT